MGKCEQQREAYRFKRQEQMSRLELYRMEKFLTDGSRKKCSYVPEKEKKRLMTEYPIKFIVTDNRWVGDLETIWSILCEKFPEATKAYKNYKECQYGLKYGAAPCEWREEDESNSRN